MVGRELTVTNVDVDARVVEEVIGQLLNLSWPGSRPHEDLFVWPDLLDTLPDLGLETHAQHPVSLIQHQVGSPLEVHLANLQEVNQPSRSSNHYLSSLIKLC